MFAWSSLHTVYLHVASASWVRVPATLEFISKESHRSDDGYTYSVNARYRYRYNGVDYVSNQVGYDSGSDNLGSYHDDTVAAFRRYVGRSQGVQVWVDPDQPQDSYLQRHLRWEKLAFGTLFGVIFAAAGLGIMFMHKLSNKPVMENGQSVIYSNEKKGYWLFAFMSFMFFAMSSPGVLAIPDEIKKGNWAILVVLLFPLAAGWMAFLAWRMRYRWQYYGPMPVLLTPFPGQLGGDVAGSFPLLHYREGADYELTLQCIKVTVTGSGKNRSRSERVVWQQKQFAYAALQGAMMALRFHFTPPSDLPETSEKGRVSHEWRLLLAGPEQPVPLERSWTLPVQQGTLTAAPLPQTHVSSNERRQRFAALESLNSQIRIDQQGSLLVLSSVAGRNKGMALMLLLMGIGFSVAAGFMAKQGFEGDGMLVFMAFVFGLFGIPMFLGGLFMAARSLEVAIQQNPGANQVMMIRRWGGLSLWRRQGELTATHQLTLADGGSVNQGNKMTRYFHLEMKTADGRKLRLAEGMEGEDAAKVLKDELVRLLQLT